MISSRGFSPPKPSQSFIVKSPRIYTYRVAFEEIPHWYWGVHKEKKFGETYLGSPVTHAWMWDFYTPKTRILEVFPYTEEGWKEANCVEDRLILPDLNNPLCLNESCGGVVSLAVCAGSGVKTGPENGRRNSKNNFANHLVNNGKKNAKNLMEYCRENGKNSVRRNLVPNCVENGRKNGADNGRKNSRPVFCVETGVVYPSVSEASRSTGINHGSIINSSCKGCRAGGYHWEFLQ